MTDSLILGVLASGRGTNLQAILDACEAGLPATVGVVVSDVADAKALERAASAGVDAFFVDPAGSSNEDYERRVVEILLEHNVEVVCLAGYMRIVGTTLLRAFSGRIMNIHPSLLPSFAGLDAQAQALRHGVKVTGCTVHFVDAGIDTGPIIVQRAVQVLEDDDVDTLAQRILKEEHIAYPEAICLYAKGRLKIEGRRVRISK